MRAIREPSTPKRGTVLAQPAERCPDILELGGKFGFLGKSIADAGNGKAFPGKVGKWNLFGISATPAPTMNVDDKWKSYATFWKIQIQRKFALRSS